MFSFVRGVYPLPQPYSLAFIRQSIYFNEAVVFLELLVGKVNVHYLMPGVLLLVIVDRPYNLTLSPNDFT
jgi:hypothetical protein